MARHFTPIEREAIREQILQAGLKIFSRYGLRGMRVEDVCREVGVAKGTFYGFFENKERLFLAIADRHDAQHKAEILAFVEVFEGTVAAHVEAFFDFMMSKILADPLLAIVSVPDEMAALMRKLPPERMAHEEKKDTDFLIALCNRLVDKGLMDPPDPGTVGGLMALLVSLIMQKSLISETMFARATAVLRRAFVVQLSQGIGQ